MDWLFILMPIAGVKIFWPGLIILGIGVGVIGGFFGMGGAWMVTPGLNILGFPMAFAIGTDIAHMAGKSLISTMRHGKFGNVDYKLGLIMVFGTVGRLRTRRADDHVAGADRPRSTWSSAGCTLILLALHRVDGLRRRGEEAQGQGTGSVGGRQRGRQDSRPAWSGTRRCTRSRSLRWST